MPEKSILKDSQVVWDETKGRPKRIRGQFDLPLGDTIDDQVGAFLRTNADELGLQVGEEGLKTIQDVKTPARHVVRLQQQLSGTPVYGTEILVQLDADERVRQLDLEHVSPPRIVEPAAGAQKLTTGEAIHAARDAVGEHTLRKRTSTPQEVYFPTPEGLRLAYSVLILTKDPLHDWRVVVDAYTSDVLHKEDLLLHWPQDGQGLVFDPNPVVTSGNNALRDPDATVASCGFAGSTRAVIDAERATRTLKDISKSGANYRLEGPYVNILDSPQETNKHNFNYSSGDANNRFEAVNAYYHLDTIQRFVQGLGITSAHSSTIDVDPDASQEGGSYSPGDDTIRLGHSGPCRPDRGEDGDCMLHEYGHAMQYAQVPTWGAPNSATGRYETRAMGEGFGDILACVYFAVDHQYQREVVEDWVFADVGGLRSVDGTKVYPTDWTSSHHANGEIWSSALWNIYRVTGGDGTPAEREAARRELLKTLILSHFRLSGGASMPDGAEAYMEENEELEDFLLRNGIHIIDSFHDRGILSCSASSDLKITGLWSQKDNLSIRSWEQVEAGQDNWFYATVRNDGSAAARAFVLTFSFKSPFSTPVFPADFRNSIISAAASYDLGPGASTTVWARWPKDLIPPIPAGATERHGCIMAEVYNPADHIAPGVTTIGASNGKLKQRNTDIVDLLPDETADYFLDIGSYSILHPQLLRLEIIREPRWQTAEITLHHPNPEFLERILRRVEVTPPVVARQMEPVRPWRTIRMIDPARIAVDAPAVRGAESGLIMDLAPGSTVRVPAPVSAEVERDIGVSEALQDADFMRSDAELVRTDGGAHLRVNPGTLVGFPYMIQPRLRAPLNVKVKAPRDARPGDRFTVQIKQRTVTGEVVGEFDITVNVVEHH